MASMSSEISLETCLKSGFLMIFLPRRIFLLLPEEVLSPPCQKFCFLARRLDLTRGLLPPAATEVGGQRKGLEQSVSELTLLKAGPELLPGERDVTRWEGTHQTGPWSAGWT